jgi:hypothetical protein
MLDKYLPRQDFLANYCVWTISILNLAYDGLSLCADSNDSR